MKVGLNTCCYYCNTLYAIYILNYPTEATLTINKFCLQNIYILVDFFAHSPTFTSYLVNVFCACFRGQMGKVGWNRRTYDISELR